MGKLTAVQVKSAKPQDKPFKMYDGGGLYLLVKSMGSYWRYDYRFQGKRKTFALGVYPEVSLKDARDKHMPGECIEVDVVGQLADFFPALQHVPQAHHPLCLLHIGRVQAKRGGRLHRKAWHLTHRQVDQQ